MKKSKFSESQIVRMLKEVETRVMGTDLCRTHGISQSTSYKWQAKYGGMEASDLRRMRELEEENRPAKTLLRILFPPYKGLMR